MTIRVGNEIITSAEAGYINQDVKDTASPSFAALTINGAGGVVALTPAAQAAGAGTVGAAVTGTAGAGSAASGGAAGANGGAASIGGGAGGASDGTDAAGLGGAATVQAGSGGAANTAIVGGDGALTRVLGGNGGAGSAGAAGGAGGDAVVNAGAGGVTGGAGAGADGSVLIGSANTTIVQLANATDNPVVQVLGSGNINLLGGGDILNERLVQVVITATGGTGGATAGTVSVQVNDLAGTAVTHAVDLELNTSLTQYAGTNAATGTALFGAATTGTLNAGNGTVYAHITTDATGLYEGAINDAADETVYVSAKSPSGGHSALANGCVVVAVVPDGATWSA